MVVPFAVAVGVGMALGLLGAPILWVLAIGAACAGLYMWNTRAPGGGSLRRALASYVGLFVLMGLLAGAGYLMGGFFVWARLDA